MASQTQANRRFHVRTPSWLRIGIHYNDIMMGTMASQITTLTIVYSTVIQAQIKENIKAPRHWPLCREFTGTGEFHAQRASNAENVFIWWRHHGELQFVFVLFYCGYIRVILNSSLPEQNDHFADDVFQCIFMNEKFCILIQISLKSAPKGQIGNNSSLVHVMTWRRTGDKPLPEPMLTQLTYAYMQH